MSARWVSPGAERLDSCFAVGAVGAVAEPPQAVAKTAANHTGDFMAGLYQSPEGLSAGGRTRTDTPSREGAFETPESTNFSTPAWVRETTDVETSRIYSLKASPRSHQRNNTLCPVWYK